MVRFLAIIVLCFLASSIQGETRSTDVAIYGGTPAGIAAAIAAAREGCEVVLIEPYQRLGGLVTNGLSHTDFRTLEGRTGAYLEFANRVKAHYVHHYGPTSPQVETCFEGAFAEPKVNLLIFQQMLAEYPKIQVILHSRLSQIELDQNSPAATKDVTHLDSTKPRNRIASLTLIDDSITGSTTQTTIRARIFVDATYEGDLMAKAGVAWRAGREGRDEYGESLAPDQPDKQLQAYNFRFIMTQDPRNRVAPTAPAGYRREDFLGVLAALDSGQIEHIFDYPSKCIFKAQTPALPNGKYDINDVSRNLVRLSLPGANLGWPDGDLATRRAIFQEHQRDQIGLLYFLQNDPSVPQRFREEAGQWGWCRDEFEQTGHLPEQLYVREARRMIGLHVYVQQDCEHAPGDARSVWHRDAIAMGDYGNNCHGTNHTGPRFGGTHTGEFYNSVPPYQIPYYSLLPREVDNLLVPTAISSSHVGFCALRLEPIWMVLGQAAGHAAAMASQADQPVQAVNVRLLQNKLHALGSATTYVSDVLPGHEDFQAVQWWATQGGLHGLSPMPTKPGQRGRNLHGQYFAATPGHAAELDRVLDAKTAQRWRVISILAGVPEQSIPLVNSSTTRGQFVREIYRRATELQLTHTAGSIPRLHPRAQPNTHAPGEVDNVDLVQHVIRDASRLPGIVVDDSDAELTGVWQYSSHTPPYVGAGYLHDLRTDKGQKKARFTPQLPHSGPYEVRLSHCTNVRRAANVRVIIHHAQGEDTVLVNEQRMPEHDQLFTTLGTFPFNSGRSGWVEITNADTEGKYVIADAIQFLPQ